MSGILKDFFIQYYNEDIWKFKQDVSKTMKKKFQIQSNFLKQINFVICKEKTDDMGIKGVFQNVKNALQNSNI